MKKAIFVLLLIVLPLCLLSCSSNKTSVKKDMDEKAKLAQDYALNSMVETNTGDYAEQLKKHYVVVNTVRADYASFGLDYPIINADIFVVSYTTAIGASGRGGLAVVVYEKDGQLVADSLTNYLTEHSEIPH